MSRFKQVHRSTRLGFNVITYVYALDHGFKAELMEVSDGDVAGMQRFVLKVNMHMAGYVQNPPFSA